jgi:pyruvate,water dikinase
MELGDVLITRFTNPAYNTVLLIAGAVVCEEGGPLSHAAVMGRELGIPTVVGALGAVEQISDGDTVEVDATSGRVRVVS